MLGVTGGVWYCCGREGGVFCCLIQIVVDYCCLSFAWGLIVCCVHHSHIWSERELLFKILAYVWMVAEYTGLFESTWLGGEKEAGQCLVGWISAALVPGFKKLGFLVLSLKV